MERAIPKQEKERERTIGMWGDNYFLKCFKTDFILLCSTETKTALHFALVLWLRKHTIESERVEKSL